jgi:hypothetical protein
MNRKSLETGFFPLLVNPKNNLLLRPPQVEILRNISIARRRRTNEKAPFPFERSRCHNQAPEPRTEGGGKEEFPANLDQIWILPETGIAFRVNPNELLYGRSVAGCYLRERVPSSTVCDVAKKRSSDLRAA